MLRARLGGGSSSSFCSSCSEEWLLAIFSARTRLAVGAVKSNEMFVGLGDVYEHSRQKLEWVQELGVVGVMSCFGVIEDELGFGMIAKSERFTGARMR